MKFIVDAQLPKSLSKLLHSLGYDSIHTIDLPEANKTSDDFIIRLSIQQNRVVISKDADFLESHLLSHLPKKLVIVKTGNIQNKDLLVLFQEQIHKICSLLQEADLIELTKTEIISH